MINSSHIALSSEFKCVGQGGECSRPIGSRHQLCSGRHARQAAKYSPGLCQAILRGIRNQLRADGLLKDGCYGIQALDEDGELAKDACTPENGYSATSARRSCTSSTPKKIWRNVAKARAKLLTGRDPIRTR